MEIPSQQTGKQLHYYIAFIFLMNPGCGNSHLDDVVNLQENSNKASKVLNERASIKSVTPNIETITTHNSSSESNEKQSTDSLTQTFDPQVVATFEKLAQPVESFEQWEQANNEFLSQGDATLPLLSHMLMKGDQVERELAASTLALFAPPPEAAIPALIAGLKDSLPFVRANAAAVLIQFSDHQQLTIPVFLELLNEPDSDLQQMALVNLTSLGDEAGPHVQKLTALLESKTSDPEILIPVVQLLGRIGPEAKPALPKLKQIAFEQKGKVGEAVNSAIQLIQTTVE